MSVPPQIGWFRTGEARFQGTLDGLADHELESPSLLPGWSRRIVVAHVARNADALVNLLTWASTGVETPMYLSPDDRRRGIADVASLGAASLRAEVAEASNRLARAIDGLPAGAWDALVRTAKGRTVRAAEVPWMRCRETWIHAIDLDGTASFADLPVDVSEALINDVLETLKSRGDSLGFTVVAGGRVLSSGATTVEGSLGEVTAWITGRPVRDASKDSFPRLPAWL